MSRATQHTEPSSSGLTIRNVGGGRSETSRVENYVTFDNPHIPASNWLLRLACDHRFENRGAIYCYEISNSPEGNGQCIQLIYQPPSPVRRDTQPELLQEFWNAKDATCSSRLVIVEDISTPIIELLGSSLDLDPLLFIQHLKGSGVNSDSFDRLAANDCVDTYLRNHVTSTQWYRPVSRILRNRCHSLNRAFSFPQTGRSDEDSDSEPPGLRVRRLERPLERESEDILDTNIHRDAWEIGGSNNTTHEDCPGVLAAWEEKVTVYREFRKGIEFVVILTDPLPILRDAGNTAPTLPYEHIAARWAYQRDGWPRRLASREHTRRPRTAHLDMMSWMTNQCLEDSTTDLRRPHRLCMANPMDALFRIVYLDTMTLSNIVDNRLQEIRLASQGGSQLEASIAPWRWTLMQAQLRLPILRTTISDLIRMRSSNPKFSKTSSNFRLLATRVHQSITAVAKQAEEIDAALRAELSILESRKQLLESSNISRLTELAFVFIPLTFIASAFSMQVQELQLGPPLKTFFLAAFLAVLSTYIVRFLFNSRVIRKASRKTERAARKHGQVQEGQAVPTGVYLSLVSRGALLYFFSIYGILLVCIVSLVWLWADRGEMDKGFKAVITMAIIFTLPLASVSP